jgi:hypothetical protein
LRGFLQAEFVKLLGPHLADRGTRLWGRLVAELLRETADTLAAKEAAARLDGELAALRFRP